MITQLTEKQAEILHFIEAFTSEHEVAPSIRRIADEFAISVGTVQSHLEAIKNKGYLKSKPGVYNGLKVIKSTPEIPIYGKVAAGKPIFAIENIDGYVKDSFNEEAGLFALRVTGDSMVEAGLLEGDVLIVRRQNVAQDKDIVIAMMEDEATVKRFRIKRGQKILEPANPKYTPITGVPFHIIGKVIESRRTY